jgi:hypothetical protein
VNGENVTEKVTEREVRIAGRRFRLRDRDVRGALRHLDPEPITSHYVVIANRRFPPKQVISAVTGLDRADFTTHQARRTLMRLGFPAGRRGAAASTGPARGVSAPAAAPETLAERLRPLAGQWVAVKDGDVLHVGDTPQRLVAWLSEHGQKADSVFRVPDDELSGTGLAPL